MSENHRSPVEALLKLAERAERMAAERGEDVLELQQRVEGLSSDIAELNESARAYREAAAKLEAA